MGLCVCCCESPGIQEHTKRVVTPMLLDLERLADELGTDQHLTLEELTQVWKDSVKHNKGKLTKEEEESIELTARSQFEDLEKSADGKVSFVDFISTAMGDKSVGALRALREKLNDDLKKDPKKLQTLVKRFKKWDKNGDGYVTKDELEEFISDVHGMGEQRQSLFCGCAGTSPKLSGYQLKPKLPRMKKATSGKSPASDDDSPTIRSDSRQGDIAAMLLKDIEKIDVNGDGKVDLWDVTGWALGRRRVPVELLLYDISKGATKWMGPLLLGSGKVEAFHSGVLVFGSEYWYGGKVFKTDPPCYDQFGSPLTSSKVLNFEPSEQKPELMVIRMGYTFVTHDEFTRFLREKVIERYTGIEKYDLLTHSCNHFSDEVLNFLVGEGVPEHVLQLQKMANSATNMETMRPFLNKYLGGFSGESGGGDQLLSDSKGVKHTLEEVDPSEVLGHGEVVVLCNVQGVPDNTAATVVQEFNDLVDVKYFCVQTHEITTRTGIPVACVKKRVKPRDPNAKKRSSLRRSTAFHDEDEKEVETSP